ncbi:GNAT family N-acetyltransferase [Zobellia galactanivorans]|uniref:GCN5-related N-acetyltransferase n=1 Tax=Zobellia galactanivorans (strain DSM 12802 / CCUG 47099 / CIP 106680 / NCIMB 13871 / Dsij) TaxID=63186 RepID=G0L318_ZOBGA|nr:MULTISPECIES: GNAT family N-acetyltransferase [Zobellia]MDO6808722.1 GNAT family N-acetyltransferase [Zobellia galactanivorans]OWW25697.1 GNAT family N-acetyltransferase [Zobellia sp. OII3]CAZ98331.1 GCN5-related N-acetyltransferase [Zobellia galactanivorans]
MIRKYSNKDKPKIIELLRKNTPAFFAPSEEADLSNYLDREVEDYFVYEENAVIIGAGGINYFPKLRLARISWDIINPNFQGKGVGRTLIQHRLDHLKGIENMDSIVVRTTQLAHKFYEKMGFELEKTEKDFWAKGFDLYQMKMPHKK